MQNKFAAVVMCLLVSWPSVSAWGQDGGQDGGEPDQARELRKQRAMKKLKKNPLSLDRRAEQLDVSTLPAVDEELLAEFERMITYLADPEREGRAPGSDGILDAAEFIENEMIRIGLEPAFPLTEVSADDVEVITPFASYRQPMKMGSTISATTQTMSINGIELVAGEDFEPLAFSGSETVSGTAAFAGYAIVSGPGEFMGFEGQESLEGKVAVCLKYEPMDENGNSLWNGERDGWSYNSRITYKISALERRGASAVLIVSDPNANDDTAGMMDTLESTTPKGPMMGNRTGLTFDIPVLSISPETAQMILDADGSGRPLSELIARANQGGMVESLDEATVEIEVAIQRTPAYTDNIGGILRGRGDLADEYIVVGAHYDHVGYGYFGTRSRDARGKVHPGADDNASGTSGLLIAADLIADQWGLLDSNDHARSILFLLFTAEESGLNGSRHYANNPIGDISDHAIMLNLDMIGRLESDPLEVGGFKSSDELAALAERHLDEYGLVYAKDTSVGSGRSDHASFEAKEIPNLFFFTGLHDEYHTPEDTIDLVDMEGAVRVATICSQIAFDAATTYEPFVHERERNVQDTRQEDRQPKVRIGIVPSNAADGGIAIQRVFEGTSASEAGLKPYDRITHWNGVEITSVESWAPVLLEHEPGDVVTLVVVRDDQVLEIKMTLKGIE